MDIKAIKYISMPDARLRRWLLEFLLRRLPYDTSMIPGVKYNESDPSLSRYMVSGIENYMKDDPSRNKGIIGCWIAHSKALEEIKNHDGITVILEDDFVFRRDFFEKALDMISNFQREFDIIFFDPSGTGPIEDHKIQSNIYQADGEAFPYYYGSHCLFINNHSVQKILDAKSRFPIKDVDGFYLSQHACLQTYLFYTGSSGVLNFTSDISEKKRSRLKSILMRFKYIKKWLQFSNSK